MKMGSFLFRCMFDRSFRFWLKETLIYALISYNKQRGFGSSDALMFEAKYATEVFNEETLKKIEEYKEYFYSDNIDSQV